MGAGPVQGGGMNLQNMMSVGASASASITNGVPQTATSTTVNGQTQNTVNGQAHEVQATAETPLLYVLRNELGLNAAKYGCGFARGGACADRLPRGRDQRTASTGTLA